MNQRYVRRLHKDLKKYSNQIGIFQVDMPELVTDKYQLRDAIMERTGEQMKIKEEAEKEKIQE
jgi:hypothetical protein